MPDQDGISFGGMTFSYIAKTMDAVTPGPTPSDSFASKQLYYPHCTFADAPQLDVLLVPGGLGSVPWPYLPEAIQFIQRCYSGYDQHRPLRYLISVCTGAGLLAKAGVLDGRRATTNKAAWDDITALGPETHWVAQARWVAAGNVWTTSGVSAGTDGMIAMLSKIFHGHSDIMDQVVTSMEYSRATDPDNDPYASINGCSDVLPLDHPPT
ncbi:hypothetical protein LTR85_009303 [Meristemomyces frigidus]|nr:hypothetical protein LTR85_009303 [Meristemomyces frigidus]